MKAGFLILGVFAAIAIFITISQQHNSPIIIQPLATKNYFLYRVYIRIHALFIKIKHTLGIFIKHINVLTNKLRHTKFIYPSLISTTI